MSMDAPATSDVRDIDMSEAAAADDPELALGKSLLFHAFPSFSFSRVHICLLSVHLASFYHWSFWRKLLKALLDHPTACMKLLMF